MSLYKSILKQSLHLTWHNKSLWFFGLFTAFLLGNGGEYEIIAKSFQNANESFFPNIQNIAEKGFFSFQTIENIGVIFKKDPAFILMIIAVGLIVLVLFLLLVWMIIISQIAIVDQAAKIIKSKTKLPEVGIKNGLQVGIKKFWPIFYMNLISKSFVWIAFMLISLPIVSLSTEFTLKNNLIYLILFIVLIPSVIVFSFIIKYAIAFLVIKNNNFFQSLKNSFMLFRENWLISIEMAFVLFFINLFVVGLGLAILIFALAIPFAVLMFIALKISINLFWLTVTVGPILAILFIILIGSALSTFQISSWTGLFIRLISKKKEESKIERLVKSKITTK